MQCDYNLAVRNAVVLLFGVLVVGCSSTPSSPSSPQAAPATPSSSPTAAPASNAMSSNPLDKMGIPIYPGSTQVSIDVAKPAENGSHRVQAEYSSTDDPAKVVTFYQQRLGLQAAQPPGTKLTQLLGTLPNGSFLQMYVSANGSKAKLQYYFILPAQK